jgi:ubiquinone/menaquinone biosynthesis C-methylase UbiE
MQYSGYKSMMGILNTGGFSLSPGDRVLELGCAAGRMLRNFKIVTETGEVWGADIDATAILWCQRNLCPPFKFTTVTTFPYLPFEDNFFALVYAGSVFTHIFDLSDFWLLELKRILRPGGRLYLTIHDNHTIETIHSWRPGHWAYDSVLHRQLLNFEKQFSLADGFAEFTVQRDPGVAQVFHDQAYVRKRWGQFLRVLSIQPNAYSYQAAVVLTKDGSPIN